MKEEDIDILLCVLSQIQSKLSYELNVINLKTQVEICVSKLNAEKRSHIPMRVDL